MTTKVSALKTGQTHTHQFPDVREVMLELQPTEPLYLFSRDRLARQVELPCSVEEGDYIEFGLMGAYASATSTGFNGFRSAAYFNVARGFPAGTRVCPC